MIKKADAVKKLDMINNSAACPWDLVVLDEDTGAALVISREVIRMMPYDFPGGRPVTWSECSCREWLNNDFFQSLPDQIRDLAIKSRVTTPDNCAIPGGQDTEDYVFLLSIDEYELLTDEMRPAVLNGIPCWWWLRSPGYAATDVANVMPNGMLDGGLSGHGFYSHCDCGGIRPAMYLNLN